MKKLLLSTVALVGMTSGAMAGGLDRSGQGTGAIFNENGATSFSFGVVNPSINAADTGTATTYSPAESYTQIGATYTREVNDQLSMTLVFDQPFGAAVNYDAPQATSSFGGTKADISTNAISMYGRYKVNGNVSVFGGLRLQQAQGDVALGGQSYNAGFAAGAAEQLIAGFFAGGGRPATLSEQVVQGAAAGNAAAVAAYDGTIAGNAALAAFLGGANPAGLNVDTAADVQTLAGASIAGGGYTVDIESSYGVGYSIGAAYEIPDIALRAAITYHSGITHDTSATEQNAIITSGAASTNDIEFETPQSINLDFQTGIAADTLLTASVRWAEWGAFDVTPARINTDLADLGDSYSYRLGVARRFSDELAGSVTLSYEDASNSGVSPLGPTDGLIGLTVGLRYETDDAILSGGVNYTIPGDADLTAGGNTFARSTDNSVVGVGFQAQWSF